MGRIKDWSRGETAQALVHGLAARYARFVRWSGRWRARNPEHRDAAHALAGGRAIYAFWHSRLPLMWAFPGVEPGRVHVLISAHSDGRLIAGVMERVGLKVVTGSSSKGGAQALREMIRVVAKGGCIGITPDGPRGPNMVAQAGVIALARATGVPILPISFSAKRVRFLDSWDRMQIVMPFTEGVYAFGAPIVVPRDAEEEPYRLALEASLIALTAEADAEMGHPPAVAGTVPRKKRSER